MNPEDVEAHQGVFRRLSEPLEVMAFAVEGLTWIGIGAALPGSGV